MFTNAFESDFVLQPLEVPYRILHQNGAVEIEFKINPDDENKIANFATPEDKYAMYWKYFSHQPWAREALIRAKGV